MARKSSGSAILRSVRAQLDAAATEIAAMTDPASVTNVTPLKIAYTSNDVKKRITEKTMKADRVPEIYYIPTSTAATWVVFSFHPMFQPLTFRVLVDIGIGSVGTIEDPYIPNRLA